MNASKALRHFLLVYALAVFWSSSVFATDYTYTRASNDFSKYPNIPPDQRNENWQNQYNWSPEGIPGAGDGATIPAGLPGNGLFLTGSVTVARLKFGGGIGAHVPNLEVRVTERCDWLPGGDNRGSAAGGIKLTIDPDAVLRISEGDKAWHGLITNLGRTEWVSGSVMLVGAFHNRGVFVAESDGVIGGDTTAGPFLNTGTVIKRGAGTTSSFWGYIGNHRLFTFENKGVVEVESGTLEIGFGASTGSFDIASGGQLVVKDSHVFDNTPFLGAGTSSIYGGSRFIGTIEVNGDLNLLTGNNTTVDDETAPGPTTFRGAGRLIWQSGDFRGKVVLDSGFRSLITGGAEKTAGAAFVNRGSMEWAGPGALLIPAPFRNEGSFSLLAPGDFLGRARSAGATFENAGTLNTVPGGSNGVADDVLFSNSGILNVGGRRQAGTFFAYFARMTPTGTLNVDIGGTTAGTDFDQVIMGTRCCGGPIALAGTLNVSLINGYEPVEGSKFDIITSASGKFDRVVSGRQDFEVTQAGGVTLTAKGAAGPQALWPAGPDLAVNELYSSTAEAAATNATVPEWSYGYRGSAASSALTLFTAAQHTNSSSGRVTGATASSAALQGWDPDAVLLVNTSASEIVLGSSRAVPPEQILMVPPAAGGFVAARWTAPARGRYNVLARWADLDARGGDGVSCHLVRNGTQLFVGVAPDGGKLDLPMQVLDLEAGETIDFVVGSGSNSEFDATSFNGAVVLAPAPTITSPSAPVELTEGSTLTVTAAVDPRNPAATVELRTNNEEVLGRDNEAPFEFTIKRDAGSHLLKVVARDRRGVEGVSQPIEVTVRKAAATVSAATRGTTTKVSAATASGRNYVPKTTITQWSNAGDWIADGGGPAGVPGPNDFVIVPAGHKVFLTESATVGTLTLDGEISGGPELSLTITRNFVARGVLNTVSLVINEGAKMNVFASLARFVNLYIDNFGHILSSGTGTFNAVGTTLRSNGKIDLKRSPATNVAALVQLPRLEQRGTFSGEPNTAVNAEELISGGAAHLVGPDGASLVGPDGASLISDKGVGLVGPDGASLVSDRSLGLIGADGASLIGADGASLIGADGASLAGLPAASLIGNSGRNGASTQRASEQSAATEAIAAESFRGILLSRGTVTGRGNLVGDVLNEGAFVAPGSSAGKIRVSGDYTQGSNGTLVLEVGGTTPLESDLLQVTGAATFGGNLIVKTINNFTPQASDTFTPLTYASASGSFSSVTSNAQVNIGATGVAMQVTGANPPAPKALNISTRMRVETGDNVLIAGFIVTGTSPKKVLIRGIGPSLPVSGPLADPILNLDNGAVVNDDWKSAQEQEIRDTTIPPSSDLESAIVATLQPGPHTAVLRGKNNGTGVGLVEVYDLESGTPVQLANISTRGQVQAGDNVMIGGFIIGGNYPTKVLLRAIGPSLPVPGKLEDPTLELVDANGGRITSDDWRATQEAEIIATTVPPTNDKEAAIVATLVPGFYTAIVRGKDDTVGVALVEGYNLQ